MKRSVAVGSNIALGVDSGMNRPLPQPHDSLLDLGPDIILFMDLNGRILDANQKALDAYGYSREQLLSMTIRDIRAPETRNVIESQMSQARSGGILFETVHRRKDGSVFPVEVSSHKAHLGERVGLVSIIRDITGRRQAEEALRQSERRFREFFHGANDAVFLHEMDEQGRPGRFIEVNAAACDRLGYSRDELVRMGPADIDAQDRLREVPGVIDSLIANGRVTFEMTHVSKDGRRLPVEISSHLFSLDGRSMVLSIARDVSERRRALEERERLTAEVERWAAELEATIASMAEGVLVYGPGGEIVRMNPMAETILGYTEAQRRLPMAERLALLRPETPDGNQAQAEDTPPRRALRGETVTGEVLMIHRPNGETAWVSVGAAPIRSSDGRLLGAVTTLTDVTTLYELQQQREDFLRMVSHDLRTPLTIIQSYAQRLAWTLERAGAGESEKRGVESILSAAQQMNRMIAGLVATIQVEAAQEALRLPRIELRRYLPDLLAHNCTALATDRVKLSVGMDVPPVLADPDLLERVVVNLLSNALKYSPDGSQVVLAVVPEGEEVQISVDDEGPGIPAEELPRLFQRFHRSDSSRDKGGIGLGLYTAKRLVEAQRGRIWVESRPGGGTTFHFTIPVADIGAGER